QIGQTMRVATRQIGARDERRGRMRAEAGEVLEVRLRQRRGVAHCFFRSDGAVRLDSQRQPVVVGSLSNTRLGDGEVGATNRIVDGIDANHIHWQGLVDDVLISLYITAAAANVQFDVDLAITLKREEMVITIDNRNATLVLN